ncbi:MAG: GGDEF domain-containing protein [Nevskia sp.]|nr:GGDEF domain-containing protein [Nevskia sp.]
MLVFPKSDAAFLTAKFREHERYALRMLAIFGLVGLTLWAWDYVIDPVGARATLPLRLLMFTLALIPLGTRNVVTDRQTMTLMLFAAPLIGLLVFFAILLRLKGGMAYGIGGFMYFQLVGLVVLRGCSYQLVVAFHVAAALLPNLLGLLLPAAGFEQGHYAVLLWPAAAIAAIVQHAMHQEYARSYVLRQQLEQAALTDALTGTYNRRYFSEVVGTEMARVERDLSRLSLLLVDIDHFKSINDRLGHAAGDAALKAVSAILKGQLRPSDRLFRWGGEEFVVLAPSAALADAMTLAERLRRSCESADIAGTGRVTLSIGAAEFAGETLEDWIKRADEALYNAKQNGRNRVEGAQKRR